MRAGQSYGNNNIGLLLGRVLLAILFIRFGIMKVGNFQGTVAEMHAVHAPFPLLAAIIAVVCELGGGLVIAIGFQTRIVAIIMAIYTAGTSYFAHLFWLMHGSAVLPNEINFFKNLSIIGAFIILASVGPGRYSADRR
jgi:putative oxidoreductase